MRHIGARYRLAIVSTYLPRRCGLATYTADLREALGVATDALDTTIVAIDRDGLQYGDEVLFTINQDTITDYTSAADRLQATGIDAVLIEHEYGIFGGYDGSHVLGLARALTSRGIPYVLTLHTVLSAPSAGQAATLRSLCAGAARVTVFTETARRVAIQTGLAESNQLVVVPHGAPVVLRHAPNGKVLRPEVTELVEHLRDKPTLTTFGLLSEGKGIDLAIEALAEVVKVEPRTQYVIAGQTHPEIKRYQGENYRDSLREQVKRLGLTDNVHFVDAFLGLEDLSAILHASTLFVTPYRSAEQVCSGALTFALAAGLPVVSSAYRYAEDMLARGAGRVVPIGDGVGLAAATVDLLTDPQALAQAQAAAASIASWLPWPTVAAREAELFREVVERSRAARDLATTLAVPTLNLTHLDRITDEIGILQFAQGADPDPRSGYCVDDVARLAILGADLLAAGFTADTPQGALAESWLRRSMRFLSAAYDPSHGAAMYNQLSYQGVWEDQPHLGDHVGRAMWGLGVVAGTPAVPDDVRAHAGALLDEIAVHVDVIANGQLPHIGLRTVAYALIGLARAGRPDTVAPLVERLDRELCATVTEDPSWYWFEPELTYDNARLPQALLAGAALIDDRTVAARALDSLEWYAEHLRLDEGPLRCVGNVWHRRGEDPARWLADDGHEQPLDATAVVEAFAEAWHYRADLDDGNYALHAMAWFLGRNRAGISMYIEADGGCHDGLAADWANANQGAESTLAYYQGLFSLVRVGLTALSTRDAALTGAAAAKSAGTVTATAAEAPVPAKSTATTATATPTSTNRRTLTGRATTTRPPVTDRSSTQRVRAAGAATGPVGGAATGPAAASAGTNGAGAAPPVGSPTGRATSGHRTRTTEGHTDAR